MKKSNLLIAGIFGLMLIFGFVLVGCDNGAMPDDYKIVAPIVTLTAEQKAAKADYLDDLSEFNVDYNTAKAGAAMAAAAGYNFSLPTSSDPKKWKDADWVSFFYIMEMLKNFG